MKTFVIFMVVFFACGAFSEESKPKDQSIRPDATKTNTTGSQTEESPLKKQPAGESSVETNNSVKTKVESTPRNSKMPDEGPSSHEDVSELIGDNMFSRAAYLLTGISVLVLLYFGWKSLSIRRRQTHIHKYGVVASREDLEMTSLGFGSEDEEDDTTHFDIGKHQRM